MTAISETKQAEAPPVVVGAKIIAKALSCSTRYVHLLAEAGTIPSYRWWKACIRFDQAAVFKALGIQIQKEESAL